MYIIFEFFRIMCYNIITVIETMTVKEGVNMSVVLEDYNRNDNKATYDGILEKYPVSVLEPAVCRYCLARHYDLKLTEFANWTTETVKDARILDAIKMGIKMHEGDNNVLCEAASMTNTTFSIFQYVSQVERFRRSKQVYMFDEDFLEELVDTEADIPIHGDMLATLPHHVMYLDYTANPALCLSIGADSALATTLDVTIGDKKMWVILCVNYFMGISKFVHSITLPNDRDPISMEDLIRSMCVANVTDTEVNPLHTKEAMMFATVLQSLVYLCSVDPDIKETQVSKQRYKDAKKQQKSKDKRVKADMPEREYVVGEYFGAAFRKFKTEQSARPSTVAYIGTGTAKRPHMRRAHWHNYWYGKRGSEDRILRPRWVHEAFINVTENDSDKKLSVAKHKVKK